MKKYIPNILSTYRLIFSLLLPFMFFYGNYFLVAITFVSAILSDLIDGILARKWKVESKYGKLVDMLSDKTLAIFASITFITVISKCFIIILVLEIIITLINLLQYLNNNKIDEYKSSLSGKAKTWFLFSLLLIGFFSYKIPFFKHLLFPFTVVTALTQIITSINYLAIYRNLKVLN